MYVLMAYDGSQHARNAALFASLITRPAGASVTLLGILEGRLSEDALMADLIALRDLINPQGECEVTIRVRRGPVAQQILAEAEERFYHMVVVGSRGRRHLKRLVLGSRAKWLASCINVPLLVVTEARSQIKRMLICTSGQRPGEAGVFVGGTLARLVGAEVTVLHVMSQIPLVPDAPVEDLEKTVRELIESDTQEGHHLRRALEILSEQGVASEAQRPKVRRGLVLDEIVNEIHEGDYDLLVIGAHQVPQDAPWRELRRLLQDDMTDHILSNTRRPVLVVRMPDERDKWAGFLRPNEADQPTGNI